MGRAPATHDVQDDTRRTAADPRGDGRQRVVIERVEPAIDGGRFAIKRVVGDDVAVTATVFTDGHEHLAGVLKYRRLPARGDAAAAPWVEVPLAHLGNDRWGASFTPPAVGDYRYTFEAWLDRFDTWRHGLVAKAQAGQDVHSDLIEGAALVDAAARRGVAPAAGETLDLLAVADGLRASTPQAERVALAARDDLAAMMARRPDRSHASVHATELPLVVDDGRAVFGAWYEMFPRSCTTTPARGGTFRDAEARLPAIAALGFDVVYLPPIHPIGATHRKGRNNSLVAGPDDPGSPWAIGSPAGGHDAVEPGLGTIDDFDVFVAAAAAAGLEVALDIAFQASPDHPWVREHPSWFAHRPDGTIKYAENPPKKYQDIYPFDFDSADWRGLWDALRDVFRFWLSHGVTIFRVDNPHTKAFPFWEWCIAEIKREEPRAIFLAEAFTRPAVMRYLAKLGFTQSYTYFTWRNSASELREYLTELTTTEARDYLRPNFFANTPDILTAYLQEGGRPAFAVRLVLAATLAATYGIYSGFELAENVPVRPGSEEYLDSEKYQIKPRDYDAPGNLNALITRVNGIRRQQRALQVNTGLRFHATDNPAFLWFSRSGPPSASDVEPVFVVANTDPGAMQHGWVEFPITELGIPPDSPYTVEDLLDGRRYTWRGSWNYVKLDPAERPAHVLVVRR